MKRLPLGGLLALVLLAGCSATAAKSGTTSAPTKDRASTTTTGHSAQQSWPFYGHDLANSRTNLAETTITRTTVGSLRVRWNMARLPGVTATPVVDGGVAYFGDATGTLWAVTVSSGTVLWHTATGAGDVVGSGAIDSASLFFGIGKTLFKVDKATGRVQWRATTNTDPYSQINASPILVGNLVIIGTAQFEEVVGKPPATFRGSIGAFDAATGRQLWNFFTTPNDKTSGGGEGIWSTPCVDESLGLLYVGVGQNISAPTGPLADSLLAIDVRTGKLKWHKQFTRHDVFGLGTFSGKDADVGASPNLWSVDGREMVGVGQKSGFYYALDAATGQLLWAAHLSPGSVFGGALGSAAYVDGAIIASSNVGDTNNAVTNASVVTALDPATGHALWVDHETGVVFGPISAAPGVAFVGTTSNPLGRGPSVGRYLALDTKTGSVLWSFVPPAHAGGGAAIVEGNVLWGYGFALFGPPGKGGLMDFGPS
jgi:polyvinyl alcohol dehydrogenase (cytochrome)